MHEPVSPPPLIASLGFSAVPFQMPPALRRTLAGVILTLLLLNALLLVLPVPRGAPQDVPRLSGPGGGPRTALRTVTDEHQQIALTVGSDWENVSPPIQHAMLTLRNRRNDLAILAYGAGTPEADQVRPTLADYNSLAIKRFLETTPQSSLVRSKPLRVGAYNAIENEFTLEGDDGPFFMLQTVIETSTTFYQLQSIGHSESAAAERRVLLEVIDTFRTTDSPSNALEKP